MDILQRFDSPSTSFLIDALPHMRLFLILLGFCSTLVYSTFVDSDTDEAAAKKYASEGFEIGECRVNDWA